MSDLRNCRQKGDEFDFVGVLVKVKEANKCVSIVYFCPTSTLSSHSQLKSVRNENIQ